MRTKEELERMHAVNRYVCGDRPKVICQSLNRPKKWLYKWVGRYRSGDGDWYKDDSRRPKSMPTRTPQELVSLVVSARQSLESSRYTDRGAFAIRCRLEDMGIGAPSDATINRILKDAGLTSKPGPREKVGTPYPSPLADLPNDLHQFDILGPRYLGPSRSFYVANIIDVARRAPSISPMPNKAYASIIPALIRSWRTLGIPNVLQMDNFVMSANGMHPGSICKILRLCLLVGVEPLLVPFSEPWRQGVVEKFNDTFDRSFFRCHRFSDYDDLCHQASIFEEHCQNRRLSALGGKTPATAFPDARIRLLEEDFRVNLDKLGIKPGRISFIRMVRSNLQIDVLGHKFSVGEEYHREYIKATLQTEGRTLALYHQGQQIAEYKFSMCQAAGPPQGGPRSPMS